MNDKIISAEWLKKRLKDELCFYPVMVSKAIEDAPKLDMVNREVVNQLLWEIDIMEHQLKDIGVQPMEEVGGVVKVVLCKNCKHWTEIKNVNKEKRIGSCDRFYAWNIFNENDFCSYGDEKG